MRVADHALLMMVAGCRETTGNMVCVYRNFSLARRPLAGSEGTQGAPLLDRKVRGCRRHCGRLAIEKNECMLLHGCSFGKECVVVSLLFPMFFRRIVFKLRGMAIIASDCGCGPEDWLP